VTPAVWELHWQPVTARIKYKLCMLAHKVLTVGQAPKYIVECRPADTGRRNLCPVCSPRLNLRRFPRSKTKTKIGQRAFFCCATACVESATDMQSCACADRQHCSSASLKHFCSMLHMEYQKTAFDLNCVMRSWSTYWGRGAIQITVVICNL